jgi:hypothetical protein
MKTRQMVDKSFSQHMIYQVFRAITHDIFNDKTWFPTSRCSCEDVFYEVFCIVDKMMFSHTDTESRLAFVEDIVAQTAAVIVSIDSNFLMLNMFYDYSDASIPGSPRCSG